MYEGCKGYYDFAHYVLTGTLITDRCFILGCENLNEGETCLYDERDYHYTTCRSLIPSYQKNFPARDPASSSNMPSYMYQRKLPLVYRNQWYYEDVRVRRYYGAVPTQLDPDSTKIQGLKAILDDGKEHLFDIVETRVVGSDGAGNEVAFWELIQ